MIAASFVHTWLWPANGSGGIPGDIVGSVAYTIIAAVVVSLLWPPLRHRIKAWVHRHFLGELHAKLDHIIEHSSDCPPYEGH